MRGRLRHPRLTICRHLAEVPVGSVVPVFMCGWPNGDLSFVAAASKDDAMVMLDELDNADLAEVNPDPGFHGRLQVG
jgi:hypothetical protein